MWHLFVYIFYVATWCLFGFYVMYLFTKNDEGSDVWVETLAFFLTGVLAQTFLLGSILYSAYWHNRTCDQIV